MFVGEDFFTVSNEHPHKHLWPNPLVLTTFKKYYFKERPARLLETKFN